MASSALQRMAQRAAQEREEALERCDLCGAPIAADHRHLLDVASRDLMCACRPCALLFDRDAAGAGGRHYRLVPDRRLHVDDLDLDDVTWADLRLPVDMAFFFRSTPAERVLAFYPGAMGATESLLGLEAGGAAGVRAGAGGGGASRGPDSGAPHAAPGGGAAAGAARGGGAPPLHRA